MAFNRGQMTHEAPRPEIYRLLEAQLFNVDAMSNDQIVVLSRGLTSALDLAEVGGGQQNHNIAADMLTRLVLQP